MNTNGYRSTLIWSHFIIDFFSKKKIFIDDFLDRKIVIDYFFDRKSGFLITFFMEIIVINELSIDKSITFSIDKCAIDDYNHR